MLAEVATQKSPSIPERCISNWRHVTVEPGGRLSYDLICSMFHGDIPGIRIPGFLSTAEVRSALKMVDKITNDTSRYQAIDLGTVLRIPSHWEFGYTRSEEEWDNYFPLIDAANKLRRRIFSSSGDPVESVSAILRQNWPRPVTILRHPRNGRELYAGIIRSGAPKLHVDWAHWDIPGVDVVMQAGWSIHLQRGGKGGDLRVYRTLGATPGFHVNSGKAPVGNYDLPRELVANVEFDVIPCEPGDWVIAPNRFLHEVIECTEPDRRLTVAAHVVWMGDGSLAQFS